MALDVLVKLVYLYSLYHAFTTSGLFSCVLVVLAYYALFGWLPQLFGRVALSSSDAFFLNDIPGNRQYIIGASIYERMTRQEFLILLRDRTFTQVKRFRLKLVKILDLPYWVEEPRFSVDSHAVYIENPIRDEAGLYSIFESYIDQPLNFDISPWEVTFIENYQGDKSVIILKAHHSLCDGLAAVSLLVSLADPTADNAASFVDLNKKSVLNNLTYFILSVLLIPFALVKQLIRRPDKSFLHGPPLSGTKSFCCTRRVSMSSVKAFCRRKNVKFNTCLLSCVGAAMQTLFERYNERAENFSLYLPMSTRNLPKDNSMLPIQNSLSYLMFRMSTTLAPDESRIEYTHNLIETLKDSFEPLVNTFLVKLVAILFPMTIAKPLIHLSGSQCSMLFTNVPGPSRSLYYCKKRLLNLFFYACGTGNCGIQVCGFSYDGGITLGVCCDKACLPNATELMQEIEVEMEKLETS